MNNGSLFDILGRKITKDSKILVASLGQLIETTEHVITDNALVLRDKNDYLYQRSPKHVILNESIQLITQLLPGEYYVFTRRNQLFVGQLLSRNFFFEGAPKYFFMEEIITKTLYKKTTDMILISLEPKLLTNLLLRGFRSI
jgi:hypothetical protein